MAAPTLTQSPALAAPADRLRLDDRVLITAGGWSEDFAHIVFIRPDGKYDLLTESLVNLYAYPAKILRKVG